MSKRDDFHFQPGWATPVVVDYRKPLTWLSSLFGKSPRCLAEQQGRCPGPNQCHDCNWSAQGSTKDR
ncbi:MAG: hypothetical protein ABIQ72_16660 [Usitatibacter sp.]